VSFAAVSPVLRFYVEELTGYSDDDIRDMFVRMNRFVVKLAPQEIRHAKFQGRLLNSWMPWQVGLLETEPGLHPTPASPMRAVGLLPSLSSCSWRDLRTRSPPSTCTKRIREVVAVPEACLNLSSRSYLR